MSVSTNFPTIKPSLLLDFANTGSLDPRVTFSRASTGTYYDGVTTAMAEQNLLVRSQEFDNGAWTSAASNISVTANAEVAPDGTATADTLTDNTTNGIHRLLYAYSGLSVSGGVTFTMSVFLKKGTGNYAYFGFRDGSSTNRYIAAAFDLNAGTAGDTFNPGGGTLVGSTIVSVGNGWYRCSVTGALSGTTNANPNVIIGMSTAATGISLGGFLGETYAGTGSTIYAWGAQLEQRSAVSSYTPTTTQPITNYIPVLQTAAADVARFDHNPTTGEALGLLIEEQSTNLLTYSSDFSNAAWSNFNITVTTDTVVAPDGTLTGDTLVMDALSNSDFYVYQVYSGWTSGVTYTQTWYVKSAGITWVQVTGSSGTAATNFRNINIVTGALGNGNYAAGSVTATSVGNGWYRISVTETATSTFASGRFLLALLTSDVSLRLQNVDGDGYSGVFVWGAQLEATAFPTSYIPTPSNIQVTREADAASMTGANFSSWFNIGAGTLYAEGRSVNSITGTTARRYAEIDDGTINSAISVEFRNTTQSRFNVSNSALIDGGGIIDQFSKLAGAYAVNNFAFCANGTLGIPDTSGAIPAVTQLVIGNRADLNKAGTINGHLRKISYYPQRLSDANLQALTS